MHQILAIWCVKIFMPVCVCFDSFWVLTVFH